MLLFVFQASECILLYLTQHQAQAYPTIYLTFLVSFSSKIHDIVNLLVSVFSVLIWTLNDLLSHRGWSTMSLPLDFQVETFLTKVPWSEQFQEEHMLIPYSFQRIYPWNYQDFFSVVDSKMKIISADKRGRFLPILHTE